MPRLPKEQADPVMELTENNGKINELVTKRDVVSNCRAE
jgi:hypothetical protein